MKLTSSQTNILRITVTVALRVLVTAAAIIALVFFALATVLNAVFNGPSVTARNELALTLMSHESTRDIPSYFLSPKTLDRICGHDDNLPGQTSDPTLVTVGSGESAAVSLNEEHYTAVLTFCPAAARPGLNGAGTCFAGFTQDGVLVVSTASDPGYSLSACEQILMMDGQINESLFNRDSGRAARSAIGQRADGTLILITVSGGTSDCPGATYQDLINIMTEYGAVNACCLRSGTASEE